MNARISRTALIDRNTHTRDCWLCFIATEGASDEPEYFAKLQALGVIHQSRVRLVLLATPAEDSQDDGPDPEHVMARLVEMGRKVQLEADDQLWLMVDVDHHKAGRHKERFVQVIREASQRGYQLAVSNPCFEIWLLLHFLAEHEVCAVANIAGAASQACKRALGQLRAQRGEDLYQGELFNAQTLDLAIERARRMDIHEKAPWPVETGTHVYRLARVLPRG